MLISTLLLQYALAIEPMEPIAICQDRMTHIEEKKQCETKARTLKLNKYAATACNALDDDKKFLSCWQSISGGEFNNEALSRCVESPEDTDDAILSCILSVKNKRLPASIKPVPQVAKTPIKPSSKIKDKKK